MSQLAVTARPTPAAPTRTAPAAFWPALRFELVKLLSPWRVRLFLLVCLIGPAAFVIAVSGQTALPSDTVFGRWMLASGWAGALVVLSFACSWVLPLITSLVAGDVFAAEDRLGTWRHLIMAVRSPRRIFAAKIIASTAVILVLVTALAASAIAGGLIAVGSHPLVGLDGQSIPAGRAATLVVLAWTYVAVATLAFAAVGWVGSIALGRSPMGLLLPAVLALGFQLCQMLPLPLAVRFALPSQAFVAWRGIFTEPRQGGPLLAGLAASLAWTLLGTALAYAMLRRRDFTDVTYDGSLRRTLTLAVAPLTALILVSALVIGLMGGSRPAGGVQQDKLQNALAASFAHLYRLQSQQLHRPDVTEAQLNTSASCDKGGGLVADEGPGNDWRCVVTWHIPGATAEGSAIYQVQVSPDGRLVADGDGPITVNGYFLVSTPTGDQPNPLWQIDGLVDLLAGQ